jgi:LPXTG-site transpeptidase (sortase) family protein
MGARRSKFFVLVVALVAMIVCAFSSACTSQSGAAGSFEQSVAPQGVAGQVPPGWPVWIEIPGKLDRTDMNPEGVAPGPKGIDPVDNRPAFRADSNYPGSNSKGTSFVYGHNYTDSSGAFVPFSTLELVEPGDTIVLGTVNGELTYVVDKTLTVPKSELETRDDVYENVPNRLVLITCDTIGGEDTFDNEIVFAQLQ